MNEKDKRNRQILREAKAVYKDSKQDLLNAGLEGQWLVGKDGEFSTFETWSEALAEGYVRFGGHESFLVKEILPRDKVYSIWTPEFAGL